MKFIPLLIIPLLFLGACSSTEEPEEKEEPEVIPTAPVDPPPPLPDVPPDGIDFVSPNTTDELLSEEKKKTVTGPALAPKPIEGDTVINVPPPLPTPSLPDE